MPLTDDDISQAQFRALANLMPTLAWMAHPDGWIFWYNRRWYEYSGTTPAEMAGWGWQSLHDPERLPDVLVEWSQAIAHGKSFEMVFPLRGADGVFRPFLTRIEPLRENGAIVGWFGNNTEISEQERGRERLQLMVNELNHRVKNTLATVQSIAAQSFAGVPPETRKSFDDRLMALSKVHDVLTRESWAKASLSEVVTTAIAYCDGGRFDIVGEDVAIAPAMASALAMTMHELCTNAAKYGALSVPGGRVAIEWQVDTAASGPPLLRLNWVERGGPPVAEPARKGFGHNLISRVLKSDRNSMIDYRFEPGGVEFHLTAPIGLDVVQ